MTTQTDLIVSKSINVQCSPTDAFELFTERLATWWPFESHSISDQRPDEVVFEGREGGRVYDRLASGKEEEWATILAWEPPQRFVVDWHVSPGRPSTELEVRFLPEGDGTRVELEHRGWELYGERAAEVHASYNSGWDTVLGRYVAKAS
jgi:hypothetical protein